MRDPAPMPTFGAGPRGLSLAAVNAAIDRALVFLASRQLHHGEIPIHRFASPDLSGAPKLDSSPFATALALIGLREVEHPLVPLIRGRAERFLQEEREGAGLWRYWSSRHGTKIDPDLDDTCCASFALAGDGARSGENVAVILGNRHSSGLFKTWLRDPDEDNDVDGVVNANVLLCLGERDETRAARDIVCDAIRGDREAQSTCYYLDPLALYHAVARAYRHGVAGFAACRASILAKTVEPAGPRGALAAALRVATRVYFDADPSSVEADVAHLLSAASADGGFERAAFYSGPEPPAPRSVWWGSEELTTAIAVEALALYARRSSQGTS